MVRTSPSLFTTASGHFAADVEEDAAAWSALVPSSVSVPWADLVWEQSAPNLTALSTELGSKVIETWGLQDGTSTMGGGSGWGIGAWSSSADDDGGWGSNAAWGSGGWGDSASTGGGSAVISNPAAGDAATTGTAVADTGTEPRVIFRGPPSTIKQHTRGPNTQAQSQAAHAAGRAPLLKTLAVGSDRAPRAPLQPLLPSYPVSVLPAQLSSAIHLPLRPDTSYSVLPDASFASALPFVVCGAAVTITVAAAAAATDTPAHVGRAFNYFIQGLGEEEPPRDDDAEMDRLRHGMKAYAAREERRLVNICRHEAKMKQGHAHDKIRALEAHL
ncbi:hypothetical protein DFH09DRAFT_1099443 [Mycena vulgaris]|nr:hypothetical protein DFH09DRAFT_1099443 [Mycena vulgaris]